MYVTTLRALALAPLLTIAACGWKVEAGDFTYNCQSSVHPLDGPYCEHRLNDDYLLTFGEGGGGDDIMLGKELDGHGSANLINDASEDLVAQVGLNDQLIFVRLRSGRIFVAPARDARSRDIVGPLSEDDFTARYPNAPPWRTVQ